MYKAIITFLSLLLFGCVDSNFKKEWTTTPSPPTFTARFETTKGSFDIEVKRDWSPKAADRLYQLIKHGYYNDAIFYRVVPGFVAQFGNTDTTQMNHWRSVKIPDEEVRQSNIKGTVSFARMGKESRDLEVFINLSDNTVLDTLDFEGVRGFPPVGRITKGMQIVENLYGGYAEKPMSDANLYQDRSRFYKSFPKLDWIKKAYLIEEN